MKWINRMEMERKAKNCDNLLCDFSTTATASHSQTQPTARQWIIYNNNKINNNNYYYFLIIWRFLEYSSGLAFR
ncbi:hypothetical protein Glove_216g81 [Diversispora epigaea]|uniref:Uncharacterized protein n=1 Tax=Diversispora epigaea TaxID=1348612 RepID=A0A397INB9_9GLOM|nr:hypothetical protein Glove_216g81 [Diversispora epigaea]